MESKKQELTIKLLLLGDQAVGKSSLMMRYTDDEFNFNIMGTAGVDLKRKTLVINGENIKVNIYDTAGHERFRLIAKSQYKGSKGIVIIYDITDKKSFENITYWMNHIKENSDSAVEIMLVGNKIDLSSERAVQFEEGQALAEKNSVSFTETSAKTGENVEAAFFKLVQNIYNHESAAGRQETVNTTALNQKKKTNSKCC